VLLALFAAYELSVPKPDVRTYDAAPPHVRGLYDIHGVQAICMGHTHRPQGTWNDNRFWGNSGSWCPAFHDRECTRPVLDGRPLLWLTSEDGKLSAGLHWLRNGAIEADPT
jgi:hypothetical protein